MVKSKAKKAEKSKVKLKSSLKNKTKFLPKGGNVTKTDFKIKPIVIQTQLAAKSTEQPLSKRNLTFKELLTRLNHHNVNVKSGGCEGLSELINCSNSEIVEAQLHTLFQSLSKLVLDRETKVRRLVIKLIDDILAKVSVIKLEPFFDVLIMYTVCAMTHIDVNVQEDSLLMIDAFLKHIPSLIAKHHIKLFPNFLTLISKLRSQSNPSRTLTLNLQGSATSVKWRINVLSRLEGILKAILNERGDLKPKKSYKTVFVESGGFFPFYTKFRKITCDYAKFGGRQMTTTDDSIANHLDVLLPLLHETWAETIPKQEQMAHEENTSIDGDTASILRCTIGIFCLLWELFSESEQKLVHRFLNGDNPKYFNHVLLLFPYIRKTDISVGQSKFKKKQPILDISNDPKCISENLSICYMFCVLYENLMNKKMIEQASAVASYMNICLVNRNYVKSGNVNLLLKTLHIIFFQNYSKWHKRKVNIDNLLKSVIHFYSYNKLSADVNVEIIKLLSQVVHVPILNRTEEYMAWLGQLPKLMCEPEITVETIDCLSVLSRMASEHFQNALLANLRKIFDNLPRIEIKGSDLYPPRFKIVNMFAIIPNIPDVDLEYVDQLVKRSEDEKLSAHIDNVFRERKRLYPDCTLLE